jgi:hypothetical protein
MEHRPLGGVVGGRNAFTINTSIITGATTGNRLTPSKAAGAYENVNDAGGCLCIFRTVEGRVEIKLLPNVFLIQKGKQKCTPSELATGGVVSDTPFDSADWKRLMCGMVVLKCDRNLMKIVPASESASSFSNVLHCWQENSNQNADDRDDHQYFHERKGTLGAHRFTVMYVTHVYGSKFRFVRPAQNKFGSLKWQVF